MSGKYAGLNQDPQFGMTPAGTMIRDAWIFGLLPETQDCTGWDVGMLQNLYEQVHREWEKYGHLPSRLPPELQARHEAVHKAAIQAARAQGWDAELSEDD